MMGSIKFSTDNVFNCNAIAKLIIAFLSDYVFNKPEGPLNNETELPIHTDRIYYCPDHVHSFNIRFLCFSRQSLNTAAV